MTATVASVLLDANAPVATVIAAAAGTEAVTIAGVATSPRIFVETTTVAHLRPISLARRRPPLPTSSPDRLRDKDRRDRSRDRPREDRPDPLAMGIT